MIRKTAFALLGVALALAAAAAPAAERAYTEGTVWDVTFVKTKYGYQDDYVKQLSGEFKKIYDQAIKDGLIRSYKILAGQATHPDDWDLLILTEYANYAAMDGLSEKYDAINAKVFGSEKKADDADKKMRGDRVEVRQIWGDRLLRELILK